VKTRLGPRGIGLPSVLVCSLVAVSGPARSLLGRTPLVFFAISAVTSSCPIATGIGQYISMLLPGLQQQTRREAHPDYAVATVPPLQRWSGRQRSQRSCRSPASPYHQRYFSLGARVPGFQWEHAEYIAGIGDTLPSICPAGTSCSHLECNLDMCPKCAHW
jgi:hypothetical protein